LVSLYKKYSSLIPERSQLLMGLPCCTFSGNYTEHSTAFRTKDQWLILVFNLIFACTITFWLLLISGLTQFIPLTLANVICIYIIAVLGLQIMTGYCGQLSGTRRLQDRRLLHIKPRCDAIRQTETKRTPRISNGFI